MDTRVCSSPCNRPGRVVQTTGPTRRLYRFSPRSPLPLPPRQLPSATGSCIAPCPFRGRPARRAPSCVPLDPTRSTPGPYLTPPTPTTGVKSIRRASALWRRGLERLETQRNTHRMVGVPLVLPEGMIRLVSDCTLRIKGAVN